MDRKQERAFEEFIAESGDALPRLATLLTSDREQSGAPYPAHFLAVCAPGSVKLAELGLKAQSGQRPHERLNPRFEPRHARLQVSGGHDARNFSR